MLNRKTLFVVVVALSGGVATADLISLDIPLIVAVIDHGTPHGDPLAGTFAIANAIDEGLTTFTVLDDDDAGVEGTQNHMVFDLGSAVTIGAVQLYPRLPHGAPINPTTTEVYRFDGDDPGGSEIPVATIEFEGVSTTDPELFADTFSEQDFPAFTGRYVGLRFLAGGDLGHANTHIGDVYFSTPEPGTAALAGLGLVGALGLLRRRPKRASWTVTIGDDDRATKLISASEKQQP